MNSYRHHLLGALALSLSFSGFTACESERDSLSAPNRVQAMIEENIHDTRHEWKAGETIGVYMLEEQTRQLIEDAVNVPYQKSMGNGYFTAIDPVHGIELPFLGEPATFFAYYPYSANLGNDTSNPCWSISDWDVQQQDWHQVDLMIADYVTGRSKAQNRVQFSFRHQFAMIKLNFSIDAEHSDLRAEDLIGAQIVISNASRNVTCQLFGKTLIQGAATNQDIHFCLATDGHAAVVVLPPDDNAMQGSNRVISVSLTNGNTYRWKIDDSLMLESGYCYVWDVTLAGNSTISAVLQATITDWNDNQLGNVELEAD